MLLHAQGVRAGQAPRCSALPLRPMRAPRPVSSRVPASCRLLGRPAPRPSRPQTTSRGSSAVKCRYLRGSTGPVGRPWVCVAACRRGGRLVVSAALMEADSAHSSESRAQELLATELQPNDKLDVGFLPNGLRYVILPNPAPPERFEAHLEVHAGSVDEGAAEQGIAHLVEHVTFLGSKKREGLLGTGARSNAYTDFHHTVFHVHSPQANANSGEPMLWQVLDALTEIAFEPEFLPSRIEKERKAVIAEAQMMNTIEYRVDCQLLQYLHHENALGYRFPIGKMDQVEKWDRAQIMDFWSRHYFPANATVYVVGDVDTQHTRQLIEQTFGRVSADPSRTGHNAAAARAAGVLLPPPAAARSLDPEVLAEAVEGSSTNGSNGVAGADAAGNPAAAALAAAAADGSILDSLDRMNHHLIRPPVEHQWGCGQLVHSVPSAPVSVFRHRLLQLFQLSIFCKLPIRPMTTMVDLRRAFMVRIMLSVLQFRVNTRYVEANPPFISIELDHSDSGREGCAVSTLTITSEPVDWRGAVQVAVQEVRRLQKYGVTSGELERYKTALLRDSEQLAQQSAAVPSADNLDFVMESLALGHVVIDQKQAHECLMELADTITAEEVNALAKSLLSFASHYRSEAELMREYEEDPSSWAEPGPTRATAIVACLPAFMDASGHSTGGAAPMQRGASLATTQHMDPAAAPIAVDEGSSEEEEEVPEGAVRFELGAAEIEDALAEVGLEVEAMADVEVPDALLPDDVAAQLTAARQPQFVPIPGLPAEEQALALAGGAAGAQGPEPVDGHNPAAGVRQLRLSNGIKVNYRRTDNEPSSAMLRLVAMGGRAREGVGVGPSGNGVVAVGTRTLSESGTVGSWQREQVELFCISKLINCVLEADEEFVAMDFHFAVGDGGLAAVLQLLHLFLEEPRWERAAMERSKQMYLSHFRSQSKSLERATADRIMQAMMGEDRRFRDPSPEEISALTLEGMREAVMAQLHAGNIEICVVGDFDPQELEECCLRYLGTIRPRGHVQTSDRPLAICAPPLEQRHQTWHLKDSDERACAYIAGPAPNRWGNFTAAQQEGRAAGPGAPVVPPLRLSAAPSAEEIARATAVRRAHPLYASVTLGLLTEMINSRLFTTVRDSLGLTYDVSFELSLFDRLPSGWFHVNVTSTPQKIREAMMASLQVLRNGRVQPFTQRELLRAKRTLLTRHESDLKDNLYWLGLLTHLQCEGVPLKSLSCLRDLRAMYEAATLEDVYDAYAQFDFADDKVFTCIGTSGREPQAGGSPILQQAAGGAAAAAQPGSGGLNNGGAQAMPPQMDPEAFMAAFRNFMQNMQQQQPGGRQ